MKKLNHMKRSNVLKNRWIHLAIKGLLLILSVNLSLYISIPFLPLVNTVPFSSLNNGIGGYIFLVSLMMAFWSMIVFMGLSFLWDLVILKKYRLVVGKAKRFRA
jgi:hypothetical protein